MPHDSASDGSDHNDIVNYMHRVLRDGHRRITLANEPVCDRVWRPNGDVDIQLCRVTARSASLHKYEDLPVIKRRLYTPRSAQGRLQRFSSMVAGKMLLGESSLEYDVFRNAELDPLVIGMVEQPMRIQYSFDGKKRTYTPDLLLLKSDKFELVEVKYEDEAATLEDKWQAIGASLSSLDIGFRVITERHVRKHPRKLNVDTIFRCKHVPFTEVVANTVSNLLTLSGPIPVEDLILRSGVELNQLWAMVRHLHIAVDLDEAPLGNLSLVSVRNRAAPGLINGGLRT